ncbi:hypothetical protein SAMN05443287_11633 [Micromonospora phaseoli]|uniref:Uncharacterized protein n=2 Tax=Micromonospora phaseoli TaxID=1144548 RepID=A0A1H7DQR2_9ACTN|nr:hypothetical protein CLV64_114101 [Micromonospora phaseoli]GIJ78769.1 hypothetical protein Xph01_32010 [Micromonospora phaseoli]SEK03888.1 hypothetical protein SAMN05443287_11633 [Micromonospora phaseoli]
MYVRYRWARRTALAMAALLPAAGLLTVATPAVQAAAFEQSYAYVYVDKPSEPVGTSYTPPASRNYNSAGRPNNVSRLGPGEYLILMTYLATEPQANLGVAHVTAHGHTASYCSVAYMNRSIFEDPKTGEVTYFGVAIWVHCFDASGTRLDSEFAASWANAAGWYGGISDFAYLTSTDERRTHEPALNQQFNSMGHSNKISYLGTGRYQVSLQGMGNKGLDPKAEKGHVQVTAYFQESHRCKVAYFFTLPASTQVDVNCYNADGALSDSLFTFTYSRDASLVWTPWGAYTWVQGGEVHPDEQWTYDPLVNPTITVKRGVGSEEGLYWVNTSMDGFMDKGNVQVTAEGPGPHYCKVAEWDSDQGIQVRCFKADGAPVRNPFFVSFAL